MTRKMLIGYAIIAVVAVAGLVWAVNQDIPQLLSHPGRAPGYYAIPTMQP